MRSVSFLPASLLAAALAIFSAAPACAKVTIAIDKSTQHMTVSVDGAVRYVWPVSTGRAGYDTPNGTFRPNRMELSHFSQEWDNAPMPHSMFFTGVGHAIHGSLDVPHLGSAASHGCVRLSPDHATTLYQLVEAEGMHDTTVVIAGHIPAGPACPARASAGRRRERPAARIAPYDEQQAYEGEQRITPARHPSRRSRRPTTRSSLITGSSSPITGSRHQYYRPYDPY